MSLAKKNLRIANSIISNVEGSAPEAAIYILKAYENLGLKANREIKKISKEQYFTNSQIIHNEISLLNKKINPLSSRIKKILIYMVGIIALLCIANLLIKNVFKNKNSRQNQSSVQNQKSISAIPLQAEFSEWKVDYFCNKELKGKPCLSKTQKTINKDWLGKSPTKDSSGNQIDAGNFSARFQSCINMKDSQKLFFTIGADDGYRLSIDRKIVKQDWRVDGFKPKNFSTKLKKGKHKLVLEYFQSGGASRVELNAGASPNNIKSIKTNTKINCS